MAADDADALVAAALESLTYPASSHVGIVRRSALEAILTAPDEVRRRCIVRVARDEPWQSRCAVLRPITREPAGMSVADIAAALPPAGSPLDGNERVRRSDQMDCLIDQVESTWSTLDADGKALLLPHLDVAAHAASAWTATRLWQLTIASANDGGEVPYAVIDDATQVGTDLIAVLKASPESDRVTAALIRLLAAYPRGRKPGKAWRENARSVREALRGPALIRALLDAAVHAPDSAYEAGYSTATGPIEAVRYVTDKNEPVLCGLTVLAGQLAAAEPELLPRLRGLALKAITVIGPWGNPRSIRLAGHAVQAVTDAALPASLTELLKAERVIRHGTLLRQVRKSIDALAAAQGVTRDQLLERSVEDHDLAPDSTSRRPVAESWQAVIQAGPRTATVSYEGPDGKPRKSLPPAIKSASADALTGMTADLKALRATIGNERARLDALLAAGRSWPAAQWRELYLDHPVTGQLTRTLIWQFSTGGAGPLVTGIPVGGPALVTSDGTEVPIPGGDSAEVRLWHPVHGTADEVRAWRQFLLDRQLAQPVKQAFREVYVLTPAEIETGDYSNRFAGHIFRQEQARALMKARSWTPVPLAAWDDGIYHGIARRQYPRPGGQPALRAQFFFDPADQQDFTFKGLYTYCSSDQVRFFDEGTGDAVPLAEVAPLTFSEAMRDVDLFIGVTSIGADPEWLDRGGGRRFAQYWHRWSFGDLTVSAEVRHDVLAGLVPMLAIADRCELSARFLKVRGDLRTYKIHLGSGNILMDPDDQYLCIVAARDARVGKLFLPFDDDPLLSLILSKAFLLAADARITDPSIMRQIAAR